MSNLTQNPYIVKNFSNAKLKRLLRSFGACERSIHFVNHHDAKSAWEACENLDWIEWLIREADGKFGLPALAEYKKVRELAWAEYEKVREPAWAEYEKVWELAWAKYEKVKALAWAKYKKVREPAWAEYEKVKELAWAEALKTIKAMVAFED